MRALATRALRCRLASALAALLITTAAICWQFHPPLVFRRYGGYKGGRSRRWIPLQHTANASASSSAYETTLRSISTLAERVKLHGIIALNSTKDDLIVTFGSSSLAPFVSNLLSSLARADVSSLLVGALDEAIYNACVAARVPVLRIDGTGPSGYFRKDYDAFKRMGARKVAFIVAILRVAPRGVWVSDADVAFFRAPSTSVVNQPLLRHADVLLSSDCIDIPRDRRGECTEANFNTGVMYLRNSERARAFVKLWAARMESVGPEPWLDDQAVFNNLVREGFEREGASGGRTFLAAHGSVLIGMVPVEEIANGHTFFVQHPCAMCHGPNCECGAAQPAPLPLAVHTTFQFGDTSTFAHGKFTRLVQAGAWYTSPIWLVPKDAPLAPRAPAGGGDPMPARGATPIEAADEAFLSLADDEWRGTAVRVGRVPEATGRVRLVGGLHQNDSRELIQLHK